MSIKIVIYMETISDMIHEVVWMSQHFIILFVVHDF